MGWVAESCRVSPSIAMTTLFFLSVFLFLFSDFRFLFSVSDFFSFSFLPKPQTQHAKLQQQPIDEARSSKDSVRRVVQRKRRGKGKESERERERSGAERSGAEATEARGTRCISEYSRSIWCLEKAEKARRGHPVKRLCIRRRKVVLVRGRW